MDTGSMTDWESAYHEWRNAYDLAAKEIERIQIVHSDEIARAIAGEREACAKILDKCADDWNRIRDPGMANNARCYAKKIRDHAP